MTKETGTTVQDLAEDIAHGTDYDILQAVSLVLAYALQLGYYDRSTGVYPDLRTVITPADCTIIREIVGNWDNEIAGSD